MLSYHEVRKKCSYKEKIPEDTNIYCMAYSKSIRPDGYHWGHYPYCCYFDCPIVHPELLEGAKLEYN